MTGLAASDMIASDTLADALIQRQSQLKSDLAALRSKASTAKNIPASAQRLFSLSETLLVAELNWINKEIEEVKS